jgi:hypothetical protein
MCSQRLVLAKGPMGACGSVSKAQVEAQLRDAALSKQNYDDFMKRQQRIKLLLLGKTVCETDWAWRVVLPSVKALFGVVTMVFGWLHLPIIHIVDVCVWKGPGESGKSTLFKQMKVLYGVGFTPEEIANFTLVVHHNIISAMRSLVQACEDFDHEIQCYVRRLSPSVRKSFAMFRDNGQTESSFVLLQDELEQFREISDQVVIDKEVAGILKALWADPGVQSAFAARHTFQLHDSTA